MNMAQRLEEVERLTKHNVDKKLSNIEVALNRKLERLQMRADELTQQKSSGSWKLPFVLVLIVLLGSLAAIGMFYEKMRKTRLM